MTKPPLPRFAATVAVTVELGAVDEEDAEERLKAVETFIISRLDKSTFRRLPGKPVAVYVEAQDASVA